VVRLDGDPLLRAAPLDAFHARQLNDVDFLQRTARRAHQLTPLQ